MELRVIHDAWYVEYGTTLLDIRYTYIPVRAFPLVHALLTSPRHSPPVPALLYRVFIFFTTDEVIPHCSTAVVAPLQRRLSSPVARLKRV